MKHSNFPKRPAVLAAVGLAVTVALVLSLAQPASAHCKKKHADGGPPGHCPVDPPSLMTCPTGLCIASVGKWHPDPAREYAAEKNGTYTEISSHDFGEILKTLTSPGDFQELCDAYHVLVIEWSTPKIKNFSKATLEDYLLCGGGVIFEDPVNIRAVGVNTLDIQLHAKAEPNPIFFDDTCATITSDLCTSNTIPIPFKVINNHITFGANGSWGIVGLVPYLREQTTNKVFGLYASVDACVTDCVGRGRIIFSGPDMNFHGVDGADGANDPDAEARQNQHDLLFHELDWLLAP